MVWTKGPKYTLDYVLRMRNMLQRHLEPDRIVLVTDMPDVVVEGVETVLIDHLVLPHWWGKMALLDPEVRGEGRMVYFDLDMVLLGDVRHLASVPGPFAVCENFTRTEVDSRWPCKFGSCCMVIEEGWGARVWETFQADREIIMERAGKYGDQMALERLAPGARLLQQTVHPGFFWHHSRFQGIVPQHARVAVFAGRKTPANSKFAWVQENWR